MLFSGIFTPTTRSYVAPGRSCYHTSCAMEPALRPSRIAIGAKRWAAAGSAADVAADVANTWNGPGRGAFLHQRIGEHHGFRCTANPMSEIWYLYTVCVNTYVTWNYVYVKCLGKFIDWLVPIMHAIYFILYVQCIVLIVYIIISPSPSQRYLAAFNVLSIGEPQVGIACPIRQGLCWNAPTELYICTVPYINISM